MPTDTEHGYQALSSREKVRLAAILSRLASSFDNERAAAGLLATAFISKHSLTWPEVIDALQPACHVPPLQVDPPASRRRRAGGDKGWRGYCRRRSMCRGEALDVST